MPKVQVTSQIEIDVDDMLKGVARLESSELEQFAEKVIALRAQRRAPRLLQNEAGLLQRINRGVSSELHLRYIELNSKLHEEAISPVEQAELIRLTDLIEQADVERMEALVTLAELRDISVDELMVQLGIRRPANAW